LTLFLDASLTLAWFLEDESTPAVEAVLDEVIASDAVVPALWRIEVGNALQMAVRRNRLDRAFRNSTLSDLEGLPITVDSECDAHSWSATFPVGHPRPHALRRDLSRARATPPPAAGHTGPRLG
jgi:hypothetical protein